METETRFCFHFKEWWKRKCVSISISRYDGKGNMFPFHFCFRNHSLLVDLETKTWFRFHQSLVNSEKRSRRIGAGRFARGQKKTNPVLTSVNSNKILHNSMHLCHNYVNILYSTLCIVQYITVVHYVIITQILYGTLCIP